MQSIYVCSGKHGVSEPFGFRLSRAFDCGSDLLFFVWTHTSNHEDASRFSSVPVHEVFEGQTAWKGDVEVFDLVGHPKAKRAYGWSYGDPEQFITILELPPVDSPESAVKVGGAYQIKKGKL